MADRARARAHAALRKVRARAGDGLHHLRVPDGAVLDVGKPRVVALADDGVDGLHLHARRMALVDAVLHERVVHKADVERVGQGDGRLDRAQLLQLHQAQRLAKAVENLARADDLVQKQVVLRGEDDGHPRVPGLRAHRAVPHRNAGHVRQRVARAARELPDGNAKVRNASCRHVHSFLSQNFPKCRSIIPQARGRYVKGVSNLAPRPRG